MTTDDEDDSDTSSSIPNLVCPWLIEHLIGRYLAGMKSEEQSCERKGESEVCMTDGDS